MLPERNDKMKIIHCSDLHLDSKMKSNLDSMKAKERRDEILPKHTVSGFYTGKCTSPKQGTQHRRCKHNPFF